MAQFMLQEFGTALYCKGAVQKGAQKLSEMLLAGLSLTIVSPLKPVLRRGEIR